MADDEPVEVHIRYTECPQTQFMQGKLRMNADARQYTMDDATLQHVRRMVEYLLDTGEAEDWENQDYAADHIFVSVKAVNEWLAALPANV